MKMCVWGKCVGSAFLSSVTNVSYACSIFLCHSKRNNLSFATLNTFESGRRKAETMNFIVFFFPSVLRVGTLFPVAISLFTDS